MADIFFDGRKLPRTRKAYVAFIDIMGTQTYMNISIKSTANYIFKLHAAVISAWRSAPYKNVFVYPIMDGVYITASSKEDIEKMLIRIYDGLSMQFLKDTENHGFIIRAGLAYGDVIYGHEVPYQASKIFEMDLNYKNGILLGKPMIEAYQLEGQASPFGVCLADSARKHADDSSRRFGSFNDNWKWFHGDSIKAKSDINQLKIKLLNRFNWLDDEKNPAHYDSNKIVQHKQLVEQYFVDILDK